MLSSLLDPLTPFLEHWLATPWLCWGVGPVLAANVAVLGTALLLEFVLAHSDVSLISYYQKSQSNKNSTSRRKRLADQPSFLQQFMATASTVAGPSAVVNGAISTALLHHAIPGPHPLVDSPELFWDSAIKKLLIMFVLNDFLLYWGHRIQHESTFLWQFHAVHHRIRTPRPVSVADIHPIDVTLQGGLPMIFSTLVTKPHPFLFYFFIVLRGSENVINHSGMDAWWVTDVLKLSWLPLRATVAHHDRHHLVGNHAGRATNYAESFLVWDWMFGTLASSSPVAESSKKMMKHGDDDDGGKNKKQE